MELINTNIKLKTSGGEISSIKFKGTELLYQGDESWKKTFPVIFPVIGFSDGFKVKEKNYDIPKHGFWKDLKWEAFLEDEKIVLSALHVKNNIYPFTIDIQQFISIKNNKIIMETKISNLSKDVAYFHFGLHPAFKINEYSKLFIETENNPYKILSNGKIDEEYKIDSTFMKLPFEEKFDTLVYKEVKNKECYFFYDDLKITLKHNANNLQLWKPKKDNFICIEPWYGEGDREKKLIINADEKKEINKLNSGESWVSEFSINISKK